MASPRGVWLDPKTGNSINMKFAGIGRDGFVAFVRRLEDSVLSDTVAKWDEERLLDEDSKEIERFSRIESVDDVASYAELHGPLFGQTFYSNGVCREPLDMWYQAVALMSLGFDLKAAFDSRDWMSLQDREVQFEAELACLNAKQQRGYQTERQITARADQPLYLSATSWFPNLPEEYGRFLLGDEGMKYGGWRRRSWQDPELIEKSFYIKAPKGIGVSDVSSLEARQTEEEGTPNLSACITLNSTSVEFELGRRRETARLRLQDFENEESEAGAELCRLMAEALISLHCEQITYRWVDHKYQPCFTERIRYLWFLYSIHFSKGVSAFCAQCGKPFFKTRSDKKYCSDTCRKNAHR